MEGKIPPPREKNRLTEIFSEIGSQTVPPPPVPHLEMVIFGQFPTQTRRSEENMSLRVHTPKIQSAVLTCCTSARLNGSRHNEKRKGGERG